MTTCIAQYHRVNSILLILENFLMTKSTKAITALFAFSAIAAAQLAMAAPGNLSVSLDCPDIANHGTEKVTNFGSVMTGPGIERLHVSGGSSASTNPVFAGITPAGVPMDLVAGGYTNNGVSYSASTNLITCHFASATNPSFDLTYMLQNLTNGIVTKSSAEEIHVKFNVAIKA
jgi:hypothetical protein